jgi:hypothetical protein
MPPDAASRSREGLAFWKSLLQSLGLKVDATVHEWLHVRSLYFPDPERCPEPVEGGNLLEFVC